MLLPQPPDVAGFLKVPVTCSTEVFILVALLRKPSELKRLISFGFKTCVF